MSYSKNGVFEIKFKFIIGLLCILIFIVGVGWILSTNHIKNVNYPDLQNEGTINERILTIEIERGFARVTFGNEKQGTVYFARNNSYSPSDLSFFLKKDDLFWKEENNDTIKIIRGNESFIFVLGKEIW
ncbi:MAG: hypothetical protein KF775_19740 [Cyclobacteriaceae bacterium]|nr:hypothetical protein [Cyclobacteriaceae bacterium]